MASKSTAETSPAPHSKKLGKNDALAGRGVIPPIYSPAAPPKVQPSASEHLHFPGSMVIPSA